MFKSRLTILATLIVAVAVVSTVCGHPAAQSEDKGASGGPNETTTVKSGGIKGWLKDVHEKIRGPLRDCHHPHEGGRRGGPWNWVKTKLGFAKTTTTESAPSTTATAVTGVVNEDGRPETGDGEPETVGAEGDGIPQVGDETAPGTGNRDTTGNDREPEVGDETAPDTGNRDTGNGRGPETESQDKSVDDDVFPPRPPAPVTESSAENDSNGFSGEDLTSQNTASSEAMIDPRLRMELASVKP